MSGQFFLRFRCSDLNALAREIEDERAAYATARASNDTVAEIESACRLGTALTSADQEADAAKLLEDALVKARNLADPSLTAWTLLYLATARQYLGERPAAQSMFAEGLDLATRHALRDVEHYLWHHRGRCYAEERNTPEARTCFEKALKQRIDLGEPRAEKSRQALAELEKL